MSDNVQNSAGRPKGKSDFLEGSEVSKILSLPDKRSKDGLRDYILLLLFANTPLRIGEVATLKVSNIITTNGTKVIRYKCLKKRKIKNKDAYREKVKENEIPIKEAVYTALERYLQAEYGQDYTNHPDLPLFQTLGKHGGYKKAPITPKAIRWAINKYATLANIPKRVTPHSFRATFATLCLDNGVGLATVRDLLGHEHISSTEPYLRSNSLRKKNAVESLNFV